MSVRKRVWTTGKGEIKEAWVVSYRDKAKGGSRVQRTFRLKKEADAFVVDMKGEVRDGIHIARSKSVTVAQAGKFWIATGEAKGLERATIVEYQHGLDMHIVPYLGDIKLADLTAPMVRAFEDKLREDGRSPSKIRRTRGELSMLLADAVDRALITRNVVRERARGRDTQARRRSRRSHARRGSTDPGGPGGAVAAVADDRGLHRAACRRIARPAVAGRGSGRPQDLRAAAR
jgi:integrase